MALAQTNSDSYFPQTQPQQNQYLTGNLDSQGEKAQTRWADPNNGGWLNNSNDQSYRSSFSQPSQPTTAPQNGTALGAITAGNVGQYMPGGYNNDKFNDPNKHDPKYDLGRILSKYPPGPAGLEAAKAELMATGMIGSFGKDGFTLNDKSGFGGHYIDAGNSFSDPNANHSWQWNDTFGAGQQQPGNSYFGQQQGNQNSMMGFLQKLLGGMGQQQNPYSGTFMFNPNRGFQDKITMGPRINPTGGFQPYTPPTGGFSGMGANDGPVTGYGYASGSGSNQMPMPNSFMYNPGMTMQPGVNY